MSTGRGRSTTAGHIPPYRVALGRYFKQ